MPSARISYHYRTILDGMAVSLRYRDLPRLMQVGAVHKVYPSVRYHLDTNRSPSVIRADTFWATTGGRGQGIKIGVVDDGVDETNPFFNPAGFSYPAGFPKGGKKWTTPKVIVARAFPGPGSGRQGHLALNRQDSFHGTHVAGIAAGVAGTVVAPGPDHPAVSGLSGIAPRAWIGNYRVFNVPVPTGGLDAFTPEIVLAFEAAVNDGMDVINFSGGGPEIDPSSDALIDALDNVAAAGVVPVISAGNDRDDFGLGSVGSPSNAPSAISVAAVSNLHVFGSELTVTGGGRAGEPAAHPVRLQRARGAGLDRRPDARRRRHDRRRERPARRAPRLRAARLRPERLALHLAARGLADGNGCARLARRLHVRLQGRARLRGPARPGSCSSTTASARRTSSPSTSASRPG